METRNGRAGLAPYDDPAENVRLISEIKESLCNAIMPMHTSGGSPVDLRLSAHFATRFENATDDVTRMLLDCYGHAGTRHEAVALCTAALAAAATTAREHVEDNLPAHYLWLQKKEAPSERADLIAVVDALPFPESAERIREAASHALTSLFVFYAMGHCDIVCSSGAGVPDRVLSNAIGEADAVAALWKAVAIILAEKVFWFEDAIERSVHASPQ